MAEFKYSEMFSAEQLRAELEREQSRGLFGRRRNKKKKKEKRELPGHDELPKISIKNGRIAFEEEKQVIGSAQRSESTGSEPSQISGQPEKNTDFFNRSSGGVHGIGSDKSIPAEDPKVSQPDKEGYSFGAAVTVPEKDITEKKTDDAENVDFSSVLFTDDEDGFDDTISDGFGFAGQLEAELTRVKHKREYGRMIRETIVILLGVAAAAVLISMLFLPVLRVTGSSMEPTLSSDDIVLCSRYSKLQKGDIAAFYFNNKVLLKRVIGVSGDVINISESGDVTVNGKLVDEPYIKQLALGECDLKFPYQVPENRIFVLGDNRSTSIDSRSTSVGCIADEYIIGKVFLRAFPFGKINTF